MTVSKYLRTDGYTIKDPKYPEESEHTGVRYHLYHMPDNRVKITIELDANPNSPEVGGDGLLQMLSKELIIALFKQWGNKRAVARALNISKRTVYKYVKEVMGETKISLDL